MTSDQNVTTLSAIEAYRRGYTPIPIRAGEKRPFTPGWPQTQWVSEEEVASAFTGWTGQGITNIGLVLGNNGLVDVDLDNVQALRLGPVLLPKTLMVSGRRGRPKSHYWYRLEGDAPAYRKYKMPDLVNDLPREQVSRVSVELRVKGHQTVIPPSRHPSGEWYEWEGAPWGGAHGPTVVNGRTLARQVAVVGMLSVLIENWPSSGSRHDAYLALAGGFLRWGKDVHPYWEANLANLIRVVAAVTRDGDGGETRISEVIPTTIKNLRRNAKSSDPLKLVGFGRLAEIIGNEHADMVKRMKNEVESLADVRLEPMRREATPVRVPMTALPIFDSGAVAELDPDAVVSGLLPEIRNPMEERVSTWDRVDMEPYILGQVVMPEPTVLMRNDGKGLMYPGRVNSLYGLSESGKSWIALVICQQEIAKGERVMYLDFEDSPEGTWNRLQLIGMNVYDMSQFAYVHPEDPLADMLRGRFSQRPEDAHRVRSNQFRTLLESFDPTLLVVDGMTTLYNSHGLSTNEAADTDVISAWLRSLARNGRSTVIVIDHTGKSGERGASPIGAHHKIAMVQGTAIQVVPITQPMPGALGEIELLVYKDRPGAVRAVSGPVRRDSRTQVAALVTIDSTQEGITRITVAAPSKDDTTIGDDDEEVARAVERAEREKVKEEQAQEVRNIREKLLNLYKGEVGKSFHKVEMVSAFWGDVGTRKVPGPGRVQWEAAKISLDDAVSGLVTEGWLEKSGISQGTLYTMKKAITSYKV